MAILKTLFAKNFKMTKPRKFCSSKIFQYTVGFKKASYNGPLPEDYKISSKKVLAMVNEWQPRWKINGDLIAVINLLTFPLSIKSLY